MCFRDIRFQLRRGGQGEKKRRVISSRFVIYTTMTFCTAVITHNFITDYVITFSQNITKLVIVISVVITTITKNTSVITMITKSLA